MNTLEAKIVELSVAYYTGDPAATDEEFDSLLEELKKTCPNSPILSQVGFGLRVYRDKVKLPIQIEHSLPKIRNVESFVETCDVVEVTPKVDGISCIVSYVNGQLDLACTRGDGEFGVDITTVAANFIDSIPNQLSSPKDLVIRGELYIPVKTFQDNLADTYANPRGAVSGIVLAKSSFDNAKYVKFACHDPHLDEQIPCVPVHIIDRTQMSDDYLQNQYSYFANYSDFPIDGVVLNSKIAYKVPTTEVTAKIVGVSWETSRLGQMIPIAEFESGIRLYGTAVTRASLYHAEYVFKHHLGPGSIVRVTKANEIIPYITRIVKATSPQYPTVCSKCGESTFRMEGRRLYCQSNLCTGSFLHIKRFLEYYYTCDGYKDVEKTIDALNITSFQEIEDLHRDSDIVKKLNFAGGVGSKMAMLVASTFNEDKELRADWFLASLGIRNVGMALSKRAAPNLSLIETLSPNDFCDQINAASHAREAIVLKWEIIKEAYKAFKSRIKFTEDRGDEIISSVVLTGTLSRPRKKIVELLRKHNIEVAGSVSSTTKYVVAENLYGSSSKLKKAHKLGVPIITEQYLYKIFGINGE